MCAIVSYIGIGAASGTSANISATIVLPSGIAKFAVEDSFGSTTPVDSVVVVVELTTTVLLEGISTMLDTSVWQTQVIAISLD